MISPKKFYLGVDAGGTKTKALLIDDQFRVWGKGMGGGANYHKVGLKETEDSLFLAVSQAIDQAKKKIGQANFLIQAVCLGIAGLDTAQDRESLSGLIEKKRLTQLLGEKVFLVNDSVIGLHSGVDDNYGLCLVAGTGVNSYGVNREGEEAKVSGWDYILGDQGSGYELGQKALRAVFCAWDGRGEETLLTDFILDHLKLTEVLDLVAWTYQSEKGVIRRVASLAKLVDRAARKRDPVAVKIINQAGDDLFLVVKALVEKLGLAKKEFPLVFIGGLVKPSQQLRIELEKKISRAFSGVSFITPAKGPVWGAVKLAMKAPKTKN